MATIVEHIESKTRYILLGAGLGMYGYGGGAVGFTLDNLYLRELEEEDRSVNNTGLAVYGTITKSPVATGAELVGYSGFSNNANRKVDYHNHLKKYKMLS